MFREEGPTSPGSRIRPATCCPSSRSGKRPCREGTQRGHRQNGSTAGRADVPELAAVLSDAFANRPPFTWVQPDKELRARVQPAMFQGALRYIYPVERGTEVLVDNGAILGGAVWAPPGSWRAPPWQQLRVIPGLIGALSIRHFRQYAQRGKAVEDALHRAHPSAPHWYLATLGTDPQAQGRASGARSSAPVWSAVTGRASTPTWSVWSPWSCITSGSASRSLGRSRCRRMYRTRCRCGAPSADPNPRFAGERARPAPTNGGAALDIAYSVAISHRCDRRLHSGAEGGGPVQRLDRKGAVAVLVALAQCSCPSTHPCCSTPS